MNSAALANVRTGYPFDSISDCQSVRIDGSSSTTYAVGTAGGDMREFYPAAIDAEKAGRSRRAAAQGTPTRPLIWVISSCVENGFVTYRSAPSDNPLLTSASRPFAESM